MCLQLFKSDQYQFNEPNSLDVTITIIHSHNETI